MAATLGGTFLRYNLTIGLYLASLGAGSLLCSRAAPGALAETLADVELALAALGALRPLLVHGWDAAAFPAVTRLGLEFRGPVHQAAVYGFDYGLILAVGVLSGFELPLLMRLAGEERRNEVLAVDYAGTLAGALLFAFVLLPGPGALTTAILAGMLNAFCGLYVAVAVSRRPGLGRLAAAGGVVLFTALLFACRERLHEAVFESFRLF